MKRLILCAALLAAPLAHAQWDTRGDWFDADDEVTRLVDELERLRSDRDVREFADRELAQAEDYIEELTHEPPHRIEPADIQNAERLLARAERVAHPNVRTTREREVVVIRDDDDEAWDQARTARADADAERERALAAQLEAENARNEADRLRQELGERETRVTERGVVLTLGDVLFAVGKADLKPGATRTLDKLVAAMKRDRDTTVTIEGHTDSTGRHAYNVGLSQRRANAVRGYLASKGIPSSRLQARGLGPDFPVATNATEAGRQQNRRVELVVQNEAMGLDDQQ